MPRVLIPEAEAFDKDNFSHSTVVWKKNDHFYIGNHPNRTLGTGGLELLEGTKIPDEHMYAVWNENLTEIYVKRPDLIQYDGKDSIIADTVAGEVRILEILAKNPHPNLVTYYGCVRERRYITGICLKKYTWTLGDLISGKVSNDRQPPFTKDGALRDIRAGLDHLHSVGYVHDDINPENIIKDILLSLILTAALALGHNRVVVLTDGRRCPRQQPWRMMSTDYSLLNDSSVTECIT